MITEQNDADAWNNIVAKKRNPEQHKLALLRINRFCNADSYQLHHLRETKHFEWICTAGVYTLQYVYNVTHCCQAWHIH